MRVAYKTAQGWFVGLLCLVVCSTGCQDPKTESVLADVGQTKAIDAGIDLWVPPQVAVPRLSRKGGTRATEALSMVQVDADEWGKDRFGVYVRVSVPDVKVGLIHGAPGGARLLVSGTRHGLAVPGGEGIKRDRPWFFVRFEGAKRPPDEFEVVWHQAGQLNGDPGRTQKIRVESVRRAELSGDVVQRFYEAASVWFLLRGWVSDARLDPFHAYAAAVSNRLSRGEDKHVGRGFPRRAELEGLSEPADILALDAPYSPVHSAMLVRKGLGDSLKVGGRPSKSEITGAKIRRYPWKKLRSVLGDTAKSSVEKLASFAPSDVFYVHFNWAGTSTDWTPWLSSVTAVGAMFFAESGHRTLLGGMRSLLGEGLSDRVLGGQISGLKSMALLSDDPLASIGGDLTLVFDASEEVLKSIVASLPRNTARERQYTVAGQTVQYGPTGDGQIRHRVVFRRVLILSNSTSGMTRSIQAGARAVPLQSTTPWRILSDTHEFQYFRTRKQHVGESAELFAFLGQDFWRRYTSPEYRIATGRQRRARAELASVEYAGLLYAWLSGETPKSIKSLISRGLLNRQDTVHGAGGGKIRLDRGGQAVSSWGTTSHPKPASDVLLGEVTEEEAGAYQRFAEVMRKGLARYQGSAAFHVTAKAGTYEGGFDFGPLYWKSGYRGLLDFLGEPIRGTRLKAPGLSFEFSADSTSVWRTALEGLIRSKTDHRNVNLSWLGQRVAVGVSADDGLMDAAMSLAEMLSVDGRNRLRKANLRKSIIARLPLYAQFEVADLHKLNRTIEALEVVGERVAPGALGWQDVAPHRGIKIHRVGEVLSELPEQQVGLYYAVVQNVLMVSLHHGTLIDLIDASMNENAERQDAHHGALELRHNTIVSSSINGWAEARSVSSYRVLARAWEARFIGQRPLFTQKLVSGPGGAFRLQSDGTVSHSIYGSEVAPAVPQEIPRIRWFGDQSIVVEAVMESESETRFLDLNFKTFKP